MTRAAGLLFIALGHVVGAALVLEPFGVWRIRPGLVASALFLLFIAAGYLMVAVASRLAAVHLLARVVGSTLLVLASGAAVALVLLVMGPDVRPSFIGQVSFVLIVSGLFGFFSLLSVRPIEAH